jgi:hypothetical protein
MTHLPHNLAAFAPHPLIELSHNMKRIRASWVGRADRVSQFTVLVKKRFHLTGIPVLHRVAQILELGDNFSLCAIRS